MKKITVIIGSQRKGITYKAVQELEKNLKQFGDSELDYIFLNELNLEYCRGCKLCFDKGEGFCPAKDDRDILLGKLEQSDGVILATPVYGFQVSARVKNLIDRISFLFHRPRFFGKTFMALVVHAVPVNAGKVQKYLEFIGGGLGFNVVKGCRIQSMEPMTESEQNNLKKKIKMAAERFHEELVGQKGAVPSLFRLMIFRMTRSGLQGNAGDYYDYYYYKEKGWFEADYYYETVLGPIKKLAGYFADLLGCRMFKNR